MFQEEEPRTPHLQGRGGEREGRKGYESVASPQRKILSTLLAPNVTVTLTRRNLEAAVYYSKNDRLHVLQILICLFGRSTEQVPAGFLDRVGF